MTRNKVFYAQAPNKQWMVWSSVDKSPAVFNTRQEAKAHAKQIAEGRTIRFKGKR